MRNLVFLCAITACLPALSAGCHQVERKNPKVDYMEITPGYSKVAPADVAILPVEAGKSMDADCRRKMRQSVYDLMMEKGYAPLALTYVDNLMRDKGFENMRLATRLAWNTEPLKDLFFSDGVLMVSIENYWESANPEVEGIDIWGKAALFDAGTMELLYEHYIRRKILVTDPGSREKYILQAIQDFTRDVLAYLPNKPEKTGREGQLP